MPPTSLVKGLLHLSKGGMTRSPCHRHNGAHAAAHKRPHTPLLKTFRCRRCIGSSWSLQVTMVLARALSAGHNESISSTFKTSLVELAYSHASTTRQVLPSPSNCLNVSSSVIGRHQSSAVKPPTMSLKTARD
jgi:hypothetical protein